MHLTVLLIDILTLKATATKWVYGSINWDHSYIDCLSDSSSQCSTTGITKSVLCTILSGIMHIKDPLLLIKKKSHTVCSYC